MNHKFQFVSRFFLVIAVLSFGVAVVGCQSGQLSQASDNDQPVASFGIDYESTLVAARHDDRALRRLFLLSYITDASGADEYASDLRKLLAFRGDANFTEVLGHSGWGVCEQVSEVLADNAGYGQHNTSDWNAFKKQYPRLAHLIKVMNKGRF